MADQVGHDEETHIKIKPDSLTNQRLLGINVANVKLYSIQNKEVDKYLWNI